MIETLIKLGLEGNFLSLIKDISENPVNIILNGERLRAFLLRSETI